MFQKEMIHYYQSKIREVIHNYHLAYEKNDPDGIHDLRVALKRLKAFFNLVESINPTFKAKKKFKYFQKIAKNTSGLRDVQVQQTIVEEMKQTFNLDMSDYRSFLKKKESENREKFQEFSKLNPLEKLEQNTTYLTRALQNITPVYSETKAHGRFYNLRSNLILLTNGNDLKDEILHTLRILSKETHYTIEIIQQCFHMFEDRTDFINEIKKVHQALGKWHDYYISVVYLTDFMTDNSIDPSEKPYHTMLQYLRKEKDTYKNNIHTAFDEFTKTAQTF